MNLVIGQRGITTQYRGTGSETGCKHGLSPDEKGLLFKPHTGFQDSEPSLCGCSVRLARGTRLALLPPSLLSSSPATVRSPRTWAVKEKSVRLVRPAGAAEDTAWRALMARGQGLQSRVR